MKPEGLHHISKEEITVKIPLSIILKHQQLFPEVTKKMRSDPTNASKNYTLFLCMLPLQARNRLTSVEKNEIRQHFNL